MTKSSGCRKREEKMVTKVGGSFGRVKQTVVEWLVGPTPGIARAKVDWKMEVWEITKKEAVTCYLRDETALLYQVYEKLRPRILVYGKPDPIILAEIAPMFVHKNSSGVELTVATMEKWYLIGHS